jgi:hypothetical protein
MATNDFVASDYHLAIVAEAEEEGDGDKKCNLFRCFCCWGKYCRPHVPRLPAGRDLPSDAGDDHHTWSVLVGCISAKEPFHNLRLHRFRVAASGRVIGRTDDALEPVLAVSPGGDDDDDGKTFIASASVALAPGAGGLGRLYGCYTQEPGFDGAIIRSAADLPPADAQPQLPYRAFAVDLDTESLLSPPPPPLPFLYGTYGTVSAHGKLWAPSVVSFEQSLSVRVVMHRLELDDDDASWGEAASVDMPPVHPRPYLEGYAVIGDRFILLSLSDSTFFCFDCATTGGGTLTPVKTAGGKSSSKYIPICGKAVHLAGVGDDMVVYFIQRTMLFEYRLSEDEEGKLFIAPPVEVEALWPYHYEGYGKVVHLAGRMLCAVWMNVYLPCGCAQRHALIPRVSHKCCKRQVNNVPQTDAAATLVFRNCYTWRVCSGRSAGMAFRAAASRAQQQALRHPI